MKVEIIFEQVVKFQHRVVVELQNESALDDALDEIQDEQSDDFFVVRRILDNYMNVLEYEEEYDYREDEIEYYDHNVVRDEEAE